MGVINLILNLVALLLWLSWRWLGVDPLQRSSPATLVGTLRRAEPSSFKRWHMLAALPLLLLARAWLYRQIGPTVGWNPSLPLGPIAIPFRSDLFLRMLLFSVLGFVITLAIFYLCLLLLSLANSQELDGGPMQRFTRLHLGVIDRWPWGLKLALPLAGGVILWLGLQPLLAHWGMIPRSISFWVRLQQGLVIGLSSYLLWRFLLVGFLLLNLLISYVYLGNHWFWTFASETGRNLLRPLRWLPLRIGKVDLAPALTILAVLIAAEFSERGLAALYEKLPL
jgi:uncharacterized protein YggT (Ycf19 family)